ncbi:autophagy protein 6 [Reticulomyxa filosa]|uniref:Autophagy protein 6 n=1 Tax=Reticulomyxa filosa TaxID=46433 RepID=X6M3B1_RETFI|nr:autophagy protein 6 [Reticulomyxa filosa]|eukprot:ETO07952.1 autophagy protein 6 [Reticulomyxa filosa]
MINKEEETKQHLHMIHTHKDCSREWQITASQKHNHTQRHSNNNSNNNNNNNNNATITNSCELKKDTNSSGTSPQANSNVDNDNHMDAMDEEYIDRNYLMTMSVNSKDLNDRYDHSHDSYYQIANKYHDINQLHNLTKYIN